MGLFSVLLIAQFLYAHFRYKIFMIENIVIFDFWTNTVILKITSDRNLRVLESVNPICRNPLLVTHSENRGPVLLFKKLSLIVAFQL